MLYLSSEVEDLNESYPRGKLRTWAKPTTVLKNRGMPGEMGKPVQIPKVRKKKFKKINVYIQRYPQRMRQ